MSISIKERYNLISNAKHIFSFKEEGTLFKIVELHHFEDNSKAIIELENGDLDALYTDAKSAITGLSEIKQVFGIEQPFIEVKVKSTKSNLSVYVFEVK